MGGEGGRGAGVRVRLECELRNPGAAAVAVCRSGVTGIHGLAFRPVRPGWA